MQPKTWEFLNLLLWSADLLARPTFRNLTNSYESWAYRNGLLRQVAALEKQHLIERDSTLPEDRLYRLTAQGRLHALGGREPEERWARPWDNQWRLILFDVPVKENIERDRLRQYLRGRSFGCLQNSVWITPDPVDEERKLLADGKIQVKSLTLLAARPCGGESSAELVAAAWDFAEINHRYARHISVLEERPAGPLDSEAAAGALLCWSRMERKAWLDAVTRDPLLPRSILPFGYAGEEAWRRRVAVLGEAGEQLREFTPSIP